MRKRLWFTIAVALVTLCVMLAYGAAAPGTITQKLDKYTNSNMQVLTWSWTGSADDGTVPSTGNAITSAVTTAAIAGWYVYSIETNPGSVAPTALYDIVINDAEGFDIAGGMLANRSASATEKILPRLDTANNIYGGALVDSALTLVITNQAVHSATGTVKLVLTR